MHFDLGGTIGGISGDNFRSIFELAQTGIVIISPEGEFLEVNPAFCVLVGYTEDELKKMKFQDFSVEDDLELNLRYLSELLTGKRSSYRLEKRYITKSGEIVWVDVNVGVYSHSDDRVTSMIGTVVDITGKKEYEDRLSEQREYLQAILSVTQDGFWLLNEHGKIVDVNDAFCRMSGYTREELLQLSISDIDAHEDQERAREHIEFVIREGSDTFETVHRKKNGDKFDVEISVSCMRRTEVYFVVFIRDITGRKKAETNLQHSFNLLRYIIEHTRSAVAVHDRDLKYLYVSQSYLDQYKIEEKDVIGRHHYDVFPDLPQKWRDVHQKALQGVVSSADNDPYYRDDGSVEWNRWECRPWYRADGSIGGLIVYTEVITDRVLAAEELRTSKERYQSFIEQSSEGIYRLEMEEPMDVNLPIEEQIDFNYDKAVLMECNQAFADMYGYKSPKELCGKKLTDFHGGRDNPENRAEVRKFIDAGYKGVRQETMELDKDGNEHWYTNNSIGIVEDGFLIRIWGTQLDITQQKKAEQERNEMEEQLRQAQKMEAVGRLAGGVAHDFNNLLAVIMSSAEMALPEVDPDSQLHQDLLEIDKASQRAADLTRQLLAFSRKQIIKPLFIDLNEVVADQEKMLSRLIGEDIEIKLVLKENLWSVFIDPSQIDQILANLSVNARDAIQGVGTLTIETDNVNLSEEHSREDMPIEEGEYVMLSVTDTGSGINAEMLENIFEPFFTTKGQGEGTGLGLATVYGIVKQNNGVIHVYSELGLGTAFKVYLPCHAGVAKKVEKVEAKLTLEGSETVLVVEDEESILKLAKRFLESAGYTVLVGRSPAEALGIAHEYKEDIHLLLSDVVMPGMNGKQLEEKLRMIKPMIRTMFMSGYTADVIAQRGVLDEGIEFVQKPFTMKVLAQRVREVLDKAP